MWKRTLKVDGAWSHGNWKLSQPLLWCWHFKINIVSCCIKNTPHFFWRVANWDIFVRHLEVFSCFRVCLQEFVWMWSPWRRQAVLRHESFIVEQSQLSESFFLFPWVSVSAQKTTSLMTSLKRFYLLLGRLALHMWSRIYILFLCKAANVSVITTVTTTRVNIGKYDAFLH